jgi:hypothetical protein
VGYPSGSGDLPEGTSHKLGARKQGKEDLKTGRLKRATAFEWPFQIGRALALDEDQERRLIQERVACGIDELDTMGSEGIRERWRHVVRYEKQVTGMGSKLMHDGPKRRWAQAALDLGHVAELAPAKSEADRGIGAMVAGLSFLFQDFEMQPEGLHCLDRVGKETLLRMLDFVH